VAAETQLVANYEIEAILEAEQRRGYNRETLPTCGPCRGGKRWEASPNPIGATFNQGSTHYVKINMISTDKEFCEEYSRRSCSERISGKGSPVWETFAP